MGLFTKRIDGGLMDTIRCDEPNYLIWKWHPKGSLPGHGRRENAIRWGSSLRVKEGETVVFLYGQERGGELDYIVGPCDTTLETNNLPVLASVIGLAYNGGTPFQAEVYFINTASTIQVKFGVPFFDVFEPKYPEFCVPVAVRGSILFRIDDIRKFVKIHKLETLNIQSFQLQIRDMVCKYIKMIVANAPEDHQIPVVQLERRILEISSFVEEGLSVRMQEDFGVLLTAVDITDIEIDKSSVEYRQLMAVSREAMVSKMQAQNSADVQNIKDIQKINAEDYRETLRIQREENQYAAHMQTQSANMSIHQINQQAAVGIAGAKGLGNMGAHGNGGGLNPAGMMAGMALGGAVGQNLAGVMNNAMQGNIPSAVTPPPIQREQYYVAVDGNPVGPFDNQALLQMIRKGSLVSTSQVWKKGMQDWMTAGEVAELQSLFQEVPPPLK